MGSNGGKRGGMTSQREKGCWRDKWGWAKESRIGYNKVCRLLQAMGSHGEEYRNVAKSEGVKQRHAVMGIGIGPGREFLGGCQPRGTEHMVGMWRAGGRLLWLLGGCKDCTKATTVS